MAAYQIQFGGQALTGANGWDEEDPSRVIESVITRRDGLKTDSAPKKDARVINVSGIISASSGDALRTAMASIKQILNGGQKSLQLFDDQYITAVKRSFTYSFAKNGLSCTYQIQFICPDPYFYANSASSSTGNALTAATAAEISVVVGGNAPTPVTFTVSPAAALGSIRIYNTYSTIDKWLKYYTTETDKKVPSNMTLEINTDAKTCVRAGVNGLTYFQGEFFMLEGSATNVLRVLSDVNATLNIDWRNRWY